MDESTMKAVCYWIGMLFFLLLELRSSYRAPSVSKLRRWLTNVPLTVMNGTLYHFIFATAIASQMLLAERQAVGLLQSAALPNPLQVVLGCAHS